MMYSEVKQGIYDVARFSPGILVVLSFVYGLDVMAHYETEGCEVVWFNGNDARRMEAKILFSVSLASLAFSVHLFSAEPIMMSSKGVDAWDRFKALTIDYVFSRDTVGSVVLLGAVGCASAAIWYTLTGALTGACVDTTDSELVGQVDGMTAYAWILATLVFMLTLLNSGFSLVQVNKTELHLLLRSNTLVSVARSALQFVFSLMVWIMMDSSDFLADYVNDSIYQSDSCVQATTDGVFDSGPSKLFRDTISLASIDVSRLGVVTATTSDTMSNLAIVFVVASTIDLCLALISWALFWDRSWKYTGGTGRTGFLGTIMGKIAIPKAAVSVLGGILAGIFIATLILENSIAGCPLLDSKFEQVDNLYHVLASYVGLSLAESAWNAAFHDRHADPQITGETVMHWDVNL